MYLMQACDLDPTHFWSLVCPPSGMPASHHSAGLLKQAASNAYIASAFKVPSFVTAVSSQQQRSTLLSISSPAFAPATPPTQSTFCSTSYSVEQLLQRVGSSRPWNSMKTAATDGGAVESSSTSGIDRISMNVHDCQDLLGKFKHYIPPLAATNYKGQHGKVGVVGGSNHYTGAPFFAALAAHKAGADMTFILTHPAAVPTLRSFSPDMIATPMLPASPMQPGSVDFEKWLKKLTVAVIGPGLDVMSDAEMMLAVEHLLRHAVNQGLPVIIDGSAFDILTRHPPTMELVKGYPRAVLTPNISELGRLGKCLGVDMPGPMGAGWQVKAPEIAAALKGPLLVSKGPRDVIAGGTNPNAPVIVCQHDSSLKRCGGLGDVLTGTLATFVGWTQQSLAKAEAAGQPGPDQEVPRDVVPGTVNAHPYQAAAFAACTLLRSAALAAFEKEGRAMLADDVIQRVAPTFRTLFGW